MKYSAENFNENVDYCEYIYELASEKEIELTNTDIQKIANKYVDKLYEEDEYSEDEVVKNDALASKIITKYLKSVKEAYNEELTKEQLSIFKIPTEKELFSHSGHEHIDSYDDLSYDDIEDLSNRVHGRK